MRITMRSFPAHPAFGSGYIVSQAADPADAETRFKQSQALVRQIAHRIESSHGQLLDDFQTSGLVAVPAERRTATLVKDNPQPTLWQKFKSLFRARPPVGAPPSADDPFVIVPPTRGSVQMVSVQSETASLFKRIHADGSGFDLVCYDRDDAVVDAILSTQPHLDVTRLKQPVLTQKDFQSSRDRILRIR